MGKMFSFITDIWNPVGGECSYICRYCWAKRLIKTNKMKKYTGKPYLKLSEMRRTFAKDAFIFVQDMSDLFGSNVTSDIIMAVLKKIREYPETNFLLLTKNPRRYEDFALPANAVAGATIECNWDLSDLYSAISNARPPIERMIAIEDLLHKRKFISIEPVMNWTPGFEEWLLRLKPWAVAIGYDNYKNILPEPELEKVMDLIQKLEAAGITVYKKTLREAT